MSEQNYENLTETIKQIVARVTRMQVSKISDDTNLEDLNFDSLAAAQVIALIEKKYNIEIDELQLFDVVTFKDAVELVKSYLK
ncbi:MAG: acyl carrier protein [PVC group bacterium]|nr:acyl carrier protein [PVC group bacterium]